MFVARSPYFHSMTLVLCFGMGALTGCAPLGQDASCEEDDLNGEFDASCVPDNQPGVVSPLNESTNVQGPIVIHRGTAPFNVQRQVKVRVRGGRYIQMRYARSKTVSNQFLGTPVDPYEQGPYTVELEESDLAFGGITFYSGESYPPALLDARVEVTAKESIEGAQGRQLQLTFSEPMTISPAKLTLLVNGQEQTPQSITTAQRTDHNPVLRVDYKSSAPRDEIALRVKDTMRGASGAILETSKLDLADVYDRGEDERLITMTYDNPSDVDEPPIAGARAL